MSRDEIFNLVLIILMIILLIIYSVYVIVDERKKWSKRKYYKSQINYETQYGMYMDMVKKQKIVILKKSMQLFLLNILVKVKELFIWKKM